MIEQLTIPEERILKPVSDIVTSSIATISSSSPPSSLTESLDTLFPEQKRDEKEVKTVKEALGALSQEFSSDQIRDITNEIRYLVECWVDDYERKIFKGLTLNELLHEKGGS